MTLQRSQQELKNKVLSAKQVVSPARLGHRCEDRLVVTGLSSGLKDAYRLTWGGRTACSGVRSSYGPNLGTMPSIMGILQNMRNDLSHFLHQPLIQGLTCWAVILQKGLCEQPNRRGQCWRFCAGTCWREISQKNQQSSPGLVPSHSAGPLSSSAC